MFRWMSKGRAVAAALALLVALAVPAWAGGGQGLGWGGWGAWGWVLMLVERWVGEEKDGPCIDPAGKPCTPGGAPAPQPNRRAGGGGSVP